MPTENKKAELSFDGFGINGPDAFRSRLCTFERSTLDTEARKYGPMFKAAPEMLTALRHCETLAGCQGNAEDVSLAMGEIKALVGAAIAHAEKEAQ